MGDCTPNCIISSLPIRYNLRSLDSDAFAIERELDLQEEARDPVPITGQLALQTAETSVSQGSRQRSKPISLKTSTSIFVSALALGFSLFALLYSSSTLVST